MTAIETKQLAETITKMLENLPERYRDILIQRYGLNRGEKRRTLESIGQDYSITRERVRQIENAARASILESRELLVEVKKIIAELKRIINLNGGVIPEKDILGQFTDNVDEQDYLHFLLHLGDPFSLGTHKHLKDRVWYTKEENFNAFKNSLNDLYKDLNTDEILTEKEIVNRFAEKIKKYSNDKRLLKLSSVKKLINISKQIDSNNLGQWGLAESREITLKGAKDYAFLILKETQKPLHFTEIAKKTKELFGKDINVATVHNELIKDDRFILVGRGKYGLASWKQFSGGTVADVIVEVLKESKKPLSKEEIIERVLDRKDVRKQTILINLSKKKLFAKSKDKKYTLVK